MAKECAGILGRILGHKFRPRYSVTEHEIEYESEFYRGLAQTSLGRPGIIRQERSYWGEVCERCGEHSQSY